MKNHNRIDLAIIPLGGVDKKIDCSRCPSACCRAGMKIPLSKEEAEALEDAGTELRQLSKAEAKQAQRPGRGRKYYELTTDCGNLSIDPETKQTSCDIWETEEYPRACREFVMGGYACAIVQTYRVNIGEDSFSD